MRTLEVSGASYDVHCWCSLTLTQRSRPQNNATERPKSKMETVRRSISINVSTGRRRSCKSLGKQRDYAANDSLPHEQYISCVAIMFAIWSITISFKLSLRFAPSYVVVGANEEKALFTDMLHNYKTVHKAIFWSYPSAAFTDVFKTLRLEGHGGAWRWRGSIDRRSMPSHNPSRPDISSQTCSQSDVVRLRRVSARRAHYEENIAYRLARSAHVTSTFASLETLSLVQYANSLLQCQASPSISTDVFCRLLSSLTHSFLVVASSDAFIPSAS